jgi:oligopeptide/dipeptide ABC transporter ATP-binding protein
MVMGKSLAQASKVLEVRDLKTYFYTEDGVVKAVDGVDFYVRAGEVLGLVGESGCGKSVTSFSIMRLVGPPGKIIEGEILFEGRDLLKLSEADMTRMRGDRISMIFQQPQSSLNPVFMVGDQVGEVLQIHKNMSREASWDKAIELLKLVGIPDTAKKAKAYPHEMSGGQAQRVMIAMGLALNPTLLIADEPTTALDVTIQAQILELLASLRRERRMALLLISHDLGVVSQVCDQVLVMYSGRVVEVAPAESIFRRPAHPYTAGLLQALPSGRWETVRRAGNGSRGRLSAIPGAVPDARAPRPPGCHFAPRCPRAVEACGAQRPPTADLGGGHWVACIRPLVEAEQRPA